MSEEQNIQSADESLQSTEDINENISEELQTTN